MRRGITGPVVVVLLVLAVFAGTRLDILTGKDKEQTQLTGGYGGGEVIAPVDDYPSKWKDIAQDSVFDDWGEWNRECTSFVAFRLATRNGFAMPFYDNADQWGPRARALGYAVDDTPAIGAVAWKASGHVAWVRHVEGGTVFVEDYNVHLNGTYSEYSTPASDWKYIHFKDLPAPQAPQQDPAPQGNLEVAAPDTPPEISVGVNNGGGQHGSDSTDVQHTSGTVQQTGNPQVVGGGNIQGSQGGSGSAPPPTTTTVPPPPPTTTTVPPPPPPPTTTTVPEAPATVTEQCWKYGCPTFQNYQNASGPGPTIAVGQYVEVRCKVYAPTIPSANPGGYWYLIQSAPWNGSYWAVGNTFVNGDPWDGPYQYSFNASIPDC
jgi:surface antigen